MIDKGRLNSTLTDEALMLAVRDGDVTKLGLLFDRYHGTLLDFFCRMLGNRSTAEDLVQDVFFRILKYRKTYRDQSHFTTWMFHIARNTRFDHFKKHRGEVGFPEEGIDIPSRGPFPSQQFERDQQTDLLKAALMDLPEEKRELLVLARYQEMKYEDIAQLLGVEVGVVKVRVHRAVKELREIYLKLSGEKASCNAMKSKAALRIM
jgi:RNA polymerase sigma-70 factor (ECF subfamily)